MKLYEGLKVVEFTTNIAGPTVGQWLAEYGAEEHIRHWSTASASSIVL